MRRLVKYIIVLILTAGAAVACYNDSLIREELSDLKGRVKTLEELAGAANGNISGLQNLVAVLNGKVYVDNVKETDGGLEITFSNGKTATLTNGSSPRIGVEKDADGIYYWTLDGEWLLDEGGGKLRVTGSDGADAVAPQLKIEDGYWYLSTDGGKTWTVQGKAQGDKGADAQCIFQGFGSDESYWYFTLSDGETIKVSRGVKGAKAIVAIPEWSDGAVGLGPGKSGLRFKVLPAESAEALAAESPDFFRVDVANAAVTELPITSIQGADGKLTVSVDWSVLGEEFADGVSGPSACLSIVSGDNVLSSGFFPLRYFIGAPGTESNPYKVSELIPLVEALKWTGNANYETLDNVYVKGVISRIPAGGTYTESGSNGNASFYISDDGKKKNELYIVRTLYLGNEKYTEGIDIEAGDDVVICGQFFNYMGKTPQTVNGKSYLYYFYPYELGVHEYVDLGLPSGVKWATCNVGADKPEEFGDYYAWGETEPHYVSLDPLVWKEGLEGYYWNNYKWRSGGTARLTKYCTDSDYWGGSGPVDNKTVLNPDDDAAHVKWRGLWRMPTCAEWVELIDNCGCTWTKLNGISGYRVSSMTNSNSIFLPVAGHWTETKFYLSGGGYWSSSLYTDYEFQAFGVSVSYSGFWSGKDFRHYACSIRPVRSK